MTPGYEIAEETGKKTKRKKIEKKQAGKNILIVNASPRVRNGDGERVGLMRLLEEPLEVIRLEVRGGCFRRCNVTFEKIGDAVIKRDRSPRRQTTASLDEVKELACKLGQLISHFELQDGFERLHFLFPFAITLRLFLVATAAQTVTRAVCHAIGAQVVLLAIRAFAWWVGIYAVRAYIHLAAFAFSQIAGAPRTRVSDTASDIPDSGDRISRGAEEGLATLPSWGFICRRIKEGG